MGEQKVSGNSLYFLLDFAEREERDDGPPAKAAHFPIAPMASETPLQKFKDLINKSEKRLFIITVSAFSFQHICCDIVRTLW